MSLIICPECGQSVSDSANTCPHCGYPIYKTVTYTTEAAIPAAANSVYYPNTVSGSANYLTPVTATTALYNTTAQSPMTVGDYQLVLDSYDARYQPAIIQKIRELTGIDLLGNYASGSVFPNLLFGGITARDADLLISELRALGAVLHREAYRRPARPPHPIEPDPMHRPRPARPKPAPQPVHPDPVHRARQSTPRGGQCGGPGGPGNMSGPGNMGGPGGRRGR